MFKVSEVAEMLSVEKVKIFEALIVHDEQLVPFIKKERHLTYISENGVRALELLLFNKETIVDVIDDVEEMVGNEHVLHDDHMDKFIKKNSEKKNQLRNEIIDLKRKLNVIDKELRNQDDAILHYQEILTDDLTWLAKLEDKADQYRLSTDDDEKKNGFFNRLKK